jgi:DNA polymerase-3 subunit alpha
MRGRCQPRQWKQDQLEVKVNTIELLPEVKDQLLQKITIIAPLSSVDSTLIEDLSALLEGNEGPTELHFYVQDEDGQMYVNLMARKRHITIHKELISYINEHSTLAYKIN